GMLYAGFTFSLRDFDQIHHEYPIPDLFDYSLTQGRDIFQLARQCCDGESRGMESLFHELIQCGVPMDDNAPTVSGKTWRERLAAGGLSLPANSVTDNPIILSSPRRPFSGVDVLTGDFFETAVVKISGMSTPQLNEFDRKAAFTLYFENEEAANRSLLDPQLLESLKSSRRFAREDLVAVLRHNAPTDCDRLIDTSYDELFDAMADGGALKLAVVIAGQGPEAFGMPEMYTPMQHINANRKLKKLVTVISDGRYSGVTFGAAVGHMTPEAYRGGGLLYLQTGDLLYLGLRERQIRFLNPQLLREGGDVVTSGFRDIPTTRKILGQKRMARMRERRRRITSCNRLSGHTDAAHGVVPLEVYEEAVLDYRDQAARMADNELKGVTKH
ncbi:MAG: Dihydroxy-acid dehydratase, partial [Paenibacillaceae bacterium]|nr:Dihydroxy-acid dehydratase [Paenibacillaceae bacterium]